MYFFVKDNSKLNQVRSRELDHRPRDSDYLIWLRTVCTYSKTKERTSLLQLQSFCETVQLDLRDLRHGWERTGHDCLPYRARLPQSRLNFGSSIRSEDRRPSLQVRIKLERCLWDHITRYTSHVVTSQQLPLLRHHLLHPIPQNQRLLL